MFLNLNTSSKNFIQCAVIVFLILLPSFVTASIKAKVKDIHYWSSPEYTRVVIDLSEPVEFSKSRLSQPDRVFFDLKKTSIAKEIKNTFPVGDGIVKTIRAGQFNDETVRVVFDIEEISDFKAFIIDDPVRLVIDLYGKGIKSDKQDIGVIKRKIVIDAGHGGHDPGAIGPKKLFEKDVVLDIALKLKNILKADPANDVFLTRSTDVFLPLEERTAIANRKNADLFVSIHANASPRKDAKGIETYLLNWTDDEEANRVAARENAISLRKMRALNKKMDFVEIIKSDLMRQNKRDESVNLAHYVQRSMVSTLCSSHKSVLNLGVKQALFYVLFGAKMPSVLVEVSFISNPEEENLLSSDSYRMEIARAISEGVNAYFTHTPDVQKVADVPSASRINFR